MSEITRVRAALAALAACAAEAAGHIADLEGPVGETHHHALPVLLQDLDRLAEVQQGLTDAAEGLRLAVEEPWMLH